MIFHHFWWKLKSEQLEKPLQKSLRGLHVYHLISFLLVDFSLCHSIPITTCKKFLGMESHTFSSKEQKGTFFLKKFRSFIFLESSEFQFRMAGKCFMEKHVKLPKTSELHSLRYFFSKYLEHSSLFFYENGWLEEAWLVKLTGAENILTRALSNAINFLNPQPKPYK